MSEHDRVSRAEQSKPASTGKAPAAGMPTPARTSGPSPAEAIALQRSAGNRAAARMLSRWSAHPDKDKKGILMTDEARGQWDKFNPPLAK